MSDLKSVLRIKTFKQLIILKLIIKKAYILYIPSSKRQRKIVLNK